MGTIQEAWLWVKSVTETILSEWGIVIILILSAFLSFGLGRLSVGEAASPMVAITSAPEETAMRGLSIGGYVVASRTGSVYHFPWCSGATSIKASNQIWFPSEEAAQKAGYTPSKSCKGLVQ